MGGASAGMGRSSGMWDCQGPSGMGIVRYGVTVRYGVMSGMGYYRDGGPSGIGGPSGMEQPSDMGGTVSYRGLSGMGECQVWEDHQL